MTASEYKVLHPFCLRPISSCPIPIAMAEVKPVPINPPAPRCSSKGTKKPRPLHIRISHRPCRDRQGVGQVVGEGASGASPPRNGTHRSPDGPRDAALGPPLPDGALWRLRDRRHRLVPRGRPQRVLQLRRPMGVQAPRQGTPQSFDSPNERVNLTRICKFHRPPSSTRLMSPASTSTSATASSSARSRASRMCSRTTASARATPSRSTCR